MGLRPGNEDAARRLAILKFVVVHGLTAMPRAMIQGMLASTSEEQKEKFIKESERRRDARQNALARLGLWELVSPKEREFLSATAVTMTQQQQISASWRVESAQVLAWALGRFTDLPPYDVGAKPDFLKKGAFPDDLTAFIALAQLRPQGEIDHQRDIAEMWHWRSRTRQLIERGDPFPANQGLNDKGYRSHDDIVRACASRAVANGAIPPAIDSDFPAFGKSYRDLSDKEWSNIRSITMERHFALNWLCGHSPSGQWDQTPTDT